MHALAFQMSSCIMVPGKRAVRRTQRKARLAPGCAWPRERPFLLLRAARPAGEQPVPTAQPLVITSGKLSSTTARSLLRKRRHLTCAMLPVAWPGTAARTMPMA
jgi:hypothetical protein